ncbi:MULTISPECIES: Gfo/Idh/MocA family protein [Olivibacter]|uniref:Gfo/Idh/MocA family protein n=1 Tax=Olivibacter jilunii TaxID=985016 RepID=A0ABW6B063_9SPHI|nr:Gfo/Idh/MocA family oxidoreductase [Olivibacter sp. UJ_SKK_5.1]MDX3912062.1 Gfo/Idh/MocA family oxidoreductase [Pseudosphingobacterium sp.]
MKKFNHYSRKEFLTRSGLMLSSLALDKLPSFSSRLSTDQVQVGIIGTGSRGTGLAKILMGIKGVKITALCDVYQPHLTSARQIVGDKVSTYTDYRKLLEDKNIEAVVIATPLFLHHPMAKDAIQAEKHVYLEKAMAYDIPQAIDLRKVVEASSKVFQVGFQYRYFALYHKVKEVISQNWLGKITHFECQYNRNSNWRFPVNNPKDEKLINWRMYRAYCGGPLSELCAHQIDAVHYLLDKRPIKVVGFGGVNYWKDGRETYDHIRTVYEYPEGIQSSVTSVLSNAYNGYNIRILGDRATLEIQRDKAFIYAESTKNQQGTVDGVTGATLLARTQGEAEELIFKEKNEQLPDPSVLSLQHFIHCIVTNDKPLSNAHTAYDSTIAIHMGNLAAETETVQHWKPEYTP